MPKRRYPLNQLTPPAMILFLDDIVFVKSHSPLFISQAANSRDEPETSSLLLLFDNAPLRRATHACMIEWGMVKRFECGECRA